MDCPASSGARRTGYAARRLGTGEFAGIFGRRNPRHARHLRAGSALYRDGRAGAQALGEIREAVEAHSFFITPACSGWLRGNDDAFERGSVKAMRAAKIKFQELSTPQMKKRWPQINFDGIEWGIFEPECGYLEARASLPGGSRGFPSRRRHLPPALRCCPKASKPDFSVPVLRAGLLVLGF